MDYQTQLKRFLHRRVCVDLWGRGTLWGRLASIGRDHLRFVDTIVVGELEGQGWFERMNYSQDDSVSGPRNAETIVRIEVVLHITYADDDLPEPPLEVGPDAVKRQDVSESTNRIEGSTSELIAGMTELQDSNNTGAADSVVQKQPITVRADRIEIELGVGLIPLAMPARGGDLLERIDRIRRQLASEMGVILPRVRVKDCLALEGSSYRFRVNGHIVASGKLMTDRLLAMHLNEAANSIEGIDTVEPAYGLPARWIEPKLRDEVFRQGGSVAEPAAVLTTHLAETLKTRLHELLGYQDVLHLINDLKADYGEAIADLIPNPVSISILHRILMSLLEERVSIRNLMNIIESLAYHLRQTSDHAQLLQRVRMDIGRDICTPLLGDDGCLRLVKFDERIEESLCQIAVTEGNFTQHESLLALAESMISTNRTAAIVVRRAELRRSIFEAVSRNGQCITILAQNEVPRGIGVVNVEAIITSL